MSAAAASAPNPLASAWAAFRSAKSSNIILVFVAAQVLCVFFGLLYPERFAYTSSTNIELMLRAIPQLGILAIGVGLLMISGEFDLSVGSNFVFSAYMMALVYNAGAPVGLAILLALLIGASIGLVNGLLTIKMGIPSFIATLGGMMFWRGIVLVVSKGYTESFRVSGVVESIFVGRIPGTPIQMQFVWLLAIAAVAYLLLERHRFGNHIFATGGNRQSAIAIGVDPNRVKLACFVLAGVCAAFSGVLSTLRVESVSPTQGLGLELQAIAACVIGGLSLMGGIGSVVGIFLGAALLFTISTVLLLLRAPGDSFEMFIGLLIVLAAILNNLSRKD